MNSLYTSLHKGYQPNLGLVWAIREIVSNAIDGEERNRHLAVGAMSLTYSKRTHKLVIENQGITVPTTALLMGTSESRGDENCIGQFGEGLPMALLVLARNYIPVSVVNGGEKWTPEMVASTDYRGEPVLVIHRRKLRNEHDCYRVEIENVTMDVYTELMSNFLRFDPTYDEAMTAESSGRERVLLQPQYHGRIYNKGVFVTSRKDLMFGYDMRGELNRDRTFMDEWALKSQLGSMLASCCNSKSDKFVDTLSKALVEANGVLEVSDEWSSIVYHDRLADAVASVFHNRYGEDAIAVDNEDEVKEASALGYRGIVASPLVRKVLGRKVGTLAAIRERQHTAISKVWPLADLGVAERRNFLMVTRLVGSAFAPARDISFEVVTFGSPTVQFIIQREPKKVQVSMSNLLDFEMTLTSVIRGCIAIDRSCVEPHVIMAKLISLLATGSGNLEVALTAIAEA